MKKQIEELCSNGGRSLISSRLSQNYPQLVPCKPSTSHCSAEPLPEKRDHSDKYLQRGRIPMQKQHIIEGSHCWLTHIKLSWSKKPLKLLKQLKCELLSEHITIQWNGFYNNKGWVRKYAQISLQIFSSNAAVDVGLGQILWCRSAKRTHRFPLNRPQHDLHSTKI